MPKPICDLCRKTIPFEYVDGKTMMGRWATMCMTCFLVAGVGLGTGKGQRYLLKIDSETEFVKVEG